MFRNWLRKWTFFAVAAPFISLMAAAGEPFSAPVAFTNSALPNFFAVTTNVFSGGSPENETAFAELARLGVKTILSVDGARPDLEAARRHGLRYVHLPLGYGRVPPQRVAEFIHVAQTLPGPIYVHCHHGKHRGVTAAALICQGTSGWTPSQAVSWLKRAGTGEEYAGLYQSVEAFRAPTRVELDSVVALPESSETSPLVDAMVGVDAHFKRLKAAQKLEWKAPSSPTDSPPEQEAVLLREAFRELVRARDTEDRPELYWRIMSEAETASARLRELLFQDTRDVPALNEAMRLLSQSCVDCHKPFRN